MDWDWGLGMGIGQKRDKLKILETLERKNFHLRDKLYEENQNMIKLKTENLLLNMMLSKVK
jgi:hypothetical protein